MAKVLLSNNVAIADYEMPYIVCEVNSSHNGSVDTVITSYSIHYTKLYEY